MNAMILAAGLGTRLRPWTLTHPKALVPIEGVPMLERVIRSLEAQGFDHITINVHHFAGQIKDFISAASFSARIEISDESELLLDTGGGIAHAAEMLFTDSDAVLVHNVDILSNADLRGLMNRHIESRSYATLLCSDRDSSRKLIVSPRGKLRGWRNVKTNECRPEGFKPMPGDAETAFSGIYVLSRRAVNHMREFGKGNPFPIMDFFLGSCLDKEIMIQKANSLRLLDIGKPETLARASELLDIIGRH